MSLSKTKDNSNFNLKKNSFSINKTKSVNLRKSLLFQKKNKDLIESYDNFFSKK
jgi:recombination DNA repair RAD52 pathway protein